jgi:hypothetical protein
VRQAPADADDHECQHQQAERGVPAEESFVFHLEELAHGELGEGQQGDDPVEGLAHAAVAFGRGWLVHQSSSLRDLLLNPDAACGGAATGYGILPTAGPLDRR